MVADDCSEMIQELGRIQTAISQAFQSKADERARKDYDEPPSPLDKAIDRHLSCLDKAIDELKKRRHETFGRLKAWLEAQEATTNTEGETKCG